MQITINTEDILGDETTIRDEVISIIVRSYRSAIKETVNKEVEKFLNSAIDKEMSKVVSREISRLTKNIINKQFVQTDSWGKELGTYSIADRLRDKLKEETVFKKTKYNSEKNAYTLAIENAIKEAVSSYKKEFNSEIDGQFLNECMEYSLDKLRDRLKVN